VIAENLMLKQQLIVLRRGRQRAPSLALSDRLISVSAIPLHQRPSNTLNEE
jgi:hypothetical protein